ncbi:hypothetical protein SCHPADRAFT_916213 [Schizopora paradoxa]|uniref:Uncharacterized protein n=1 Tax=Schizopora paradoxa TaxID=27342 RepID=A0A0H2S1Q2_9AGAM|nr:hypothetical protein SCHPADRAFT_916213 [Schizopora paradoxa]
MPIINLSIIQWVFTIFKEHNDLTIYQDPEDNANGPAPEPENGGDEPDMNDVSDDEEGGEGQPNNREDTPQSPESEDPEEGDSSDSDLEDPSTFLQTSLQTANLEDLQISLKFIHDLQQACLEDGKLDAETLHRLRNPTPHPLTIEDRDLLLSLKLFMSTSQASQEVYKSAREAVLERHPEDPILSYHQVRRKVQELSGVVIREDDMCPNSCLAYTGTAYGELETCPKCHESRYDPKILAATRGRKKVAQQKFCTICLGPVVQAMYRSVDDCKNMDHFWENIVKIFQIVDPVTGQAIIQSYDDFSSGSEILDAYKRGDIGRHDTLLMFSMDGAQLYKGKKSDCWIYIWVILNLSPDRRYKKKYIIPGGFIPGPNHPKDTDSFLFPGFHHVAALQKEGLRIWKASLNQVNSSKLYMVFGTGDGVGLTELNGFAGHQGAHGCRKHCGTKGRRKGKNYYAAHLKPLNYAVAGCDHGDIDMAKLSIADEPTHVRYQQNLEYLLQSPNTTQYKKRRRETGLSRPSIFQGFAPDCRLNIPVCFPIDLMHLVALNVPDLMLSLYTGKLPCSRNDSTASWTWAVLKDETWTLHGKLVAGAAPYLPGSFDKAPRNPCEKLSSGYKAWEFLVYVYGLCPALLKTVLPDLYWKHFCKLAAAMRILHQYSIKPNDLRRALKLIVEFVHGFEVHFYQRKRERIHFCRQSLHGLLHTPFEVVQLGPHPVRSQWPMERTIGNLGAEIKQPSNPYKNLSERGVLRAQVNALKILFPALDKPEKTLPRGAVDIGDGYELRRAMDTCDRAVLGKEKDAVVRFLQQNGVDLGAPKLTKWARLRLPNGQIARSAWKETLKPLEKVRMSRNVKFLKDTGNTQIEAIAEVQYYFRAALGGEEGTYALVSEYSEPDPTLLKDSSGALTVSKYFGQDSLRVIAAKGILSAVAMVPYPHGGLGPGSWYFLVEKMGLEMFGFRGDEDSDEEVNQTANASQS